MRIIFVEVFAYWSLDLSNFNHDSKVEVVCNPLVPRARNAKNVKRRIDKHVAASRDTLCLECTKLLIRIIRCSLTIVINLNITCILKYM